MVKAIIEIKFKFPKTPKIKKTADFKMKILPGKTLYMVLSYKFLYAPRYKI